MAEKKTTPVVIDNVEYALEDMTVEQQTLLNHVADLDRKIKSTQFNLDQLNVGRNAFMNALTQALSSTEEETKEEAA
jgi:cell division septum initiation protein DivIVA